MSDEVRVAIHGIGRDHLTFRILERLDPEPAGRLRATIEMRAGGFRGSIEGRLRSDDFATLHEQLREVIAGDERGANFRPREHWVEFVNWPVEPLVLRGTAIDTAQLGNMLSFEMNLDRRELPRLERQLRVLLSAHPVPAAIAG